jgi:hypothetical protein
MTSAGRARKYSVSDEFHQEAEGMIFSMDIQDEKGLKKTLNIIFMANTNLGCWPQVGSGPG